MDEFYLNMSGVMPIPGSKEERHSSLPSHGPCEHCLTRSRGSCEQNTLGKLPAKGAKRRGVLQELDDLLEFLE